MTKQQLHKIFSKHVRIGGFIHEDSFDDVFDDILERQSNTQEPDSSPLDVRSIRAVVAGMNNDQRLYFFSLISENYCKECGCDEIKYGKCHCWNDE